MYSRIPEMSLCSISYSVTSTNLPNHLFNIFPIITVFPILPSIHIVYICLWITKALFNWVEIGRVGRELAYLDIPASISLNNLILCFVVD